MYQWSILITKLPGSGHELWIFFSSLHLDIMFSKLAGKRRFEYRYKQKLSFKIFVGRMKFGKLENFEKNANDPFIFIKLLYRKQVFNS